MSNYTCQWMPDGTGNCVQTNNPGQTLAACQSTCGSNDQVVQNCLNAIPKQCSTDQDCFTNFAKTEQCSASSLPNASCKGNTCMYQVAYTPLGPTGKKSAAMQKIQNDSFWSDSATTNSAYQCQADVVGDFRGCVPIQVQGDCNNPPQATYCNLQDCNTNCL